MIGRLKGTLAEKQPPHLILDVNGVGYELEVPMTTLYRLPAVGQGVTLHTHLVVREDAHLLYGFFEKRERELFRELIRLNGVGPKLALRLITELKDKQLTDGPVAAFHAQIHAPAAPPPLSPLRARSEPKPLTRYKL